MNLTCLSGSNNISYSIRVLASLYDKHKLNIDEKEQYAFIIKLYKYILSLELMSPLYLTKIMNNILDKHYEDSIEFLLKSLNGGKEYCFNCIGIGNSGIALISNRYVLRIGTEKKHFSCPNHFRVIQSLLREEILDKDGIPCLYFEVQRLINTSDVKQHDIDELLTDLLDDGIETIDPRIILGSTDTFGYLDNYLDCQRIIPTGYGGFAQKETEYNISASFTERPLVIHDTDLIYYIYEPKSYYLTNEGYMLKLDKKRFKKKGE